jgi:hypothetical protein
MKVKKTYYNSDQMTDMNSLSNALVSSPEQISPMITHLGGREDKKFPLSFLTEGLGNTKSIEKLEYKYDVNYHFRKTRPIAQSPASTADLGRGGQPFVLTFPDKWFINQYILVSESQVQVRIMGEPVPNGSNWDYTVQIASPDTPVMPSEDVQAGKKFGQMFAPVGVDFSRGNASNWQAPAKVRHRLTTIRKSYQFSGNAKDYVASFDLPVKGGKTSKFWMDYEEWQHFLKWKEESELYLWYGKRSYDSEGVVQMKDENGQPVVIGPGLLDQIINKDTYSRLTATKLRELIGDVFFGMTDAQNVNVTLYTGTGGAREFDRAMKEELGSTNFTIYSNGKFLQGSGRELTLTGYFKRYEHIDGHTINVVKTPIFDHSALAQASRSHPESNLPIESYRMVFVDQSRYDGEPNLQMVNKKGREMLKWGVAGSVIPRGMGNTPLRASDIDGASVHFLKTCGVCLKRFDTSIDLQCVAA